MLETTAFVVVIFESYMCVYIYIYIIACNLRMDPLGLD